MTEQQALDRWLETAEGISSTTGVCCDDDLQSITQLAFRAGYRAACDEARPLLEAWARQPDNANAQYGEGATAAWLREHAPRQARS